MEFPETPEVIASNDLLIAELVCGHVAKNMAFDYKLNSDEWTKSEAKSHFQKRRALVIVQTLLLDEAEKLHG